MAFFDDIFTVAATVSLILQVTILFLLLFGYSLKRRSKYRQHGTLMLSAVILHAITIFAVMIPSFASSFSSPLTIDYADLTVLASIIHAPLGIIAFLLGIWLVGSWHFKTDMKTCFKKKLVMRATISIWIAALALGVLLYYLFYVTRMIL